jgi:hypothetical protein
VAYLSRSLVDAVTRYAPIEKICLSLYFACSKVRHYLLSSTCIVACKHDVVKYMLQNPLLPPGGGGKWAYALVEYDLTYELLRATRGQVVADFIVDHMAAGSDETCLIELKPWSLFFDGSVCNRGVLVVF